MFKTIKKFFEATFHPSHHGLGLWLLGIAAVLAAGAVWLGLWALAALSGLALAAFAWFASMVMDTLEQDKARYVEAAATRWVQDADSEAEARARMEAVSSMGAAGALASAGRINFDGAPMIDGQDIDIFGRVYGDVADKPWEFDWAEDVGTGMSMDTLDAYTPPHGMHD